MEVGRYPKPHLEPVRHTHNNKYLQPSSVPARIVNHRPRIHAKFEPEQVLRVRNSSIGEDKSASMSKNAAAGVLLSSTPQVHPKRAQVL